MSGFLSKLFGGNKSEKDVKVITPYVAKINAFFDEYQSLSNDELRHKTIEFKQRVKDHLAETDLEINNKKRWGQKPHFSFDIDGGEGISKKENSLLREEIKKWKSFS